MNEDRSLAQEKEDMTLLDTASSMFDVHVRTILLSRTCLASCIICGAADVCRPMTSGFLQRGSIALHRLAEPDKWLCWLEAEFPSQIGAGSHASGVPLWTLVEERQKRALNTDHTQSRTSRWLTSFSKCDDE